MENTQKKESQTTPITEEQPKEVSTVKPTSEKKATTPQPDNSALLKELEELRAFKAQTETKAQEVKEEIPVRDSFLSTNETVSPNKPKTEREKLYEEMLNKGAFYRDLD